MFDYLLDNICKKGSNFRIFRLFNCMFKHSHQMTITNSGGQILKSSQKRCFSVGASGRVVDCKKLALIINFSMNVSC